MPLDGLVFRYPPYRTAASPRCFNWTCGPRLLLSAPCGIRVRRMLGLPWTYGGPHLSAMTTEASLPTSLALPLRNHSGGFASHLPVEMNVHVNAAFPFGSRNDFSRERFPHGVLTIF